MQQLLHPSKSAFQWNNLDHQEEQQVVEPFYNNVNSSIALRKNINWQFFEIISRWCVALEQLTFLQINTSRFGKVSCYARLAILRLNIVME